MHRVPSIIEWGKSFDLNQKPWLLLGKGPSFGKIKNVAVDQFFLCSLNHVVRELPVTLAHVIDIDVVIDCADAIEANARFLVLPFCPHVKNKTSDKNIYDFMNEIPLLEKLAGEGRLIWYNLLSAKVVQSGCPVIYAKFFSAEAALNILAECGAKVIRSLGIDGGTHYSAGFKDLNDKTLLANGQQSFDRQFTAIAETIRKKGIFYSPLHIEAPVRVFVGTDAAQMAGVKVLEYSIKKHASISVEVVPIDDRDIPVPKKPANRAKTGFSFSRFHIPELCGYKGRAIYMDADMQVFADIAKLWTTDFNEADVLYSEQPSEHGRLPQFSVFLMNCEKLEWSVKTIIKGLDKGRYNYNQLMREFCIVPSQKKTAGLPYEWNSLEHYEPGKTCLIHYTDMPTQPWVSHANKNGHLWYQCLREAIVEGFITKDYLYEEIRKGHLSPELPSWLGLTPPADIVQKIGNWTPPFRRFSQPVVTPAQNLIRSTFSPRLAAFYYRAYNKLNLLLKDAGRR